MANELATNLIHYYGFASNANDSVAGGTNGTVSGAVNITGGTIGNCYQFDGINDRIRIGSSSTPADLNFTTGSSFSYCCWVYPYSFTGSTSVHGIVGSYFRQAISVQGSTRRLQFGFRSATIALTKSSTITLTANEWSHVAITYYPSTKMIYLFKNGSSVDSLSVSSLTGNTSNSEGWSIGSDRSRIGGNGVFFDGKIDEVSIWNRTLTNTEIQAVYNNGIGYTYPYPTGWIYNKNKIPNSLIGKVNGIHKYRIDKINRI